MSVISSAETPVAGIFEYGKMKVTLKAGVNAF